MKDTGKGKNTNNSKLPLQSFPSFKDGVLGKKVIKKLPDNFCERVLELEIQLKKGFSMETLQELISYYSCAVEYYDSINDPKCKYYSQSLNLLLTQPEILKHMNGQDRSNKRNEMKFRRKEEVKKSVKLKYEMSNHEKANSCQVAKIMKQVQPPEVIKKKQEEIIHKDLDDQTKTFQQRLEAKKKKIGLSKSAITEELDSLKNKRRLPEENQNANKSFDQILNENYNDEDCNTEKQKGDTHFLQEIESSLEKFEKNEDQDHLMESLEISNISQSGFNDKKMIRNKKIMSDLQMKMDCFLGEFNYFFYGEIFQKIVMEIEKILLEKQKVMLEVSTSYSSQVTEFELLLSSDTETTYKEQITSIINQMKEDEKNELSKLDAKYDNQIFEMKKVFRKEILKANSGILAIEEKFRDQMYSSIMNIFEQ